MIRFSAFIVISALCVDATADTVSVFNDKEAEALFLKMIEKVKSAKTVEIVCKGGFKTVGFEADVKATLLLKEGNKMRLELDTTGYREGAPYSYSMRMVSDGTRIRRRENQGPWEDFVTTRSWNESVTVNIARGGFPSGLELAKVKKEGQKEEAGMAFRPVGVPQDFILLRRDQVGKRETTPIEFTVKSDLEFAGEISAILWLDPESALPLKRMNVIRTDRTLTVTETYEKFVVDGTVDDASFVLPKE
jgi:hypothetical protein